jgi:ATP-dependent Clp protease, protease subunit
MNKPFKVLLAEHKQRKASRPEMSLTKVSGDVLTIYCYDVIGEDYFGEGIGPKRIAEALDAEKFASITIRIDSPGGDPFAASAMLNLLKSQGKPVTVIIDGLAASAASLLAMAGNEILMGSGSMFMVHNPWTIGMGNSTDFRKLADDLDAIGATMRDVYVARTGLKADELQAMMDAETWLSPQESIDKGFANGMLEAPEPEPPAPEPPKSNAFRNKLEHELSLL